MSSLDSPKLLRLTDVLLNRCREGLRVIEDYLRFCSDCQSKYLKLAITRLPDTNLSDNLILRIKDLRHSIANLEQLLQNLCNSNLLLARDVETDVNKFAQAAQPATRQSFIDVVQANFKRVEESLRSLAEFWRLYSIEVYNKAEAMRFCCYQLEKDCFICINSRKPTQLQSSPLYVLVTSKFCKNDPVQTTRQAIRGGAKIIQLREKELEDAAYLQLAQQIATVCQEEEALLIINDRPHIAALIGADGVHLGQGDLPVVAVRKLFGQFGLNLVAGKSTHSPEQAIAAIDEGADYLGVGPVNLTPTKEHRSAVGLQYVEWASENVTIPFFAIGGIDHNNIDSVVQAGARQIAVCRAVISQTDPQAAAAKLIDIIMKKTNATHPDC